MAYDTGLERSIEAQIAAWSNMEKKKMFGGVCYLTGGNICFGIWQDYLIVRTDPATAQKELQREHVRPFDVTGRPMRGWLMVAPAGRPGETALRRWLEMGYGFARGLPVK